MIVIADDEQLVRSLVSRLLGDKFIVLEAMDGEAAVHLARSYKLDIILMDIMMPKMDGYNACSIIRTDQATKGVPVVMLTGPDHELNKKLAKTMGADDT